MAKIINTAIPPGNVGFQDYNDYPDHNGSGDTAKCKADLSKAGFPHGVSLTTCTPTTASNTRIFAAIQAA